MGGFMTVMGIASQVAGMVAPYFEREATYRAEEKRQEAEAINTQMRIDGELQKAADQERLARQAEVAAETAKHEGRINEAEAAEAAYRAKARSRASLAQKGILGSATGEGILEQAESEAVGEQLKIGYSSGQKIQSLMNQADGHRREAGYYRQNAAQTEKAARLKVEASRTTAKSTNLLNGLSAAGSILGGVSSVYKLFR